MWGSAVSEERSTDEIVIEGLAKVIDQKNDELAALREEREELVAALRGLAMSRRADGKWSWCILCNEQREGVTGSDEHRPDCVLAKYRASGQGEGT
jgi:hypothetical protein